MQDPSDAYRCWGIPQVRPYAVASYHNGDIAAIAPPGEPSFLYVRGVWQRSTTGLIHLGESMLGESFWTPSQVKYLLTLCVDARWAAWTTSGLTKLDPSVFREISSGSLQPAIIEAWEPHKDFRHCMALFGYALTERVAPSIQDCLAARSNDYSIASSICSALLHMDIVSGDGIALDLADIPTVSGSLSVVIPCYNSASTIYNVVSAVDKAAQRLPHGVDWEAIVVDDASPHTLNPERFPNATKLVRSNSRLYASMARNLGLALARGRIVVFLDSDTYIAPNYLINHWLRHRLFPNLLLVSLREFIEAGNRCPSRAPVPYHDSRWQATYTPMWKGIHTVEQGVTVKPLLETALFRTFGYGHTVGPTDLPFMVKGNNLSASRRASLDIQFPSGFEGWGPEDVCFAAKLIARGAFVIPALSTGVFHMNHPPRSGSLARREEELARNLEIYRSYLQSSALDGWEEVS